MQCCLFYFVVLKYFFPFIYLRSIIATPTTLFYKTKFAETLILIYFHLAHLPTYLLHSLKSGRLLKIDSLQSLSKQANKHGCIKLTIKCYFCLGLGEKEILMRLSILILYQGPLNNTYETN